MSGVPERGNSFLKLEENSAGAGQLVGERELGDVKGKNLLSLSESATTGRAPLVSRSMKGCFLVGAMVDDCISEKMC